MNPVRNKKLMIFADLFTSLISNGVNKTFLMLFLVSVPALALAQAVGGGSTPDPVQYIVAPETPGPGEPVIIEVSGVGTFLGDAQIIWKQDGKIVRQGVGESSFSFTTGALGSTVKIHLEIDSATHGVITHTFVFAPSLVNLVWEADTSVPPLFVGKPLYSAGSRVRVVALPIVPSGNTSVSPNNLSFQWSRNGEPAPAQSGLGKSIFTFDGDQLQTAENISVDVFWQGNKAGRGEISIPAAPAQVVLYVRDPLRGLLLDQAVQTSLGLGTKEVTVQAVPYFFSTQSIANSALTFAWTLNGADTTGPNAAQGILTLRQTGQGVGQATLGISAQNNDNAKFVQQASAAIQILFGQNTSGSLFGL